MRVALGQILSGHEVAANLDLVTTRIREAADAGARLVVFPEATMCAFGTRLVPIAEPLDGPWASAVRDAASESGVTVVAGMFTPGAASASGKPRVRNTLLVTGEAEAHYDKIHLFDALGARESDAVEPGHNLTTVRIGGIVFGLATCYDVRFPEQFRSLARAGAEAIILPASWADGPGKAEQFRLLTRARALDSVSWLLAADQAHPGFPTRAARGVGESAVIRPDGTDAVRLGPRPGLLLYDLDTAGVVKLRETLPILDDERA